MAQLNITLNHEEILQLMSLDRNEAFKNLLKECLNLFMRAESEEQLGARPYERTSGRTDSRNGSYTRELKTRIGTIELTVPRHRNVPFKTLVFDNYVTSEAALVSTMAEMVVNGVSTRKVANVMETLCGTSFSKSSVSEACKELDVKVNEFKDRPLKDEYPFVTVDATYFKVRGKRVVPKALFIAYAVNSSGRREIIGFEAYPTENKDNWVDSTQKLKERGLKNVSIFTSDSHEGIKYAFGKVYPLVPWQRCQHHFLKNIVDSVPKNYRKGISSELTNMFNSETIEEARKKRDEIIRDYQDIAEKAMSCLDEGFEDAMTVMVLPQNLRKKLRTSNHIERLNKELKRRSKVIDVFPNQESLIRLMGAVLLEINEIKKIDTHRIIFSTEMKIMDKLKPVLQEIAKEQQAILVA